MKALVNKKYKLEKFPGKGGWTFARIPEVLQDTKKPFGWVKVRGTIDGYEIKKYSLIPMGHGTLFRAVRAEIRKKIKKKEGDMVHVILYPDDEPLEVPEEMLLCMKDEPSAWKFFKSLSESEQKFYIQWIYSAKKLQTKIDRLAETVNRLMKGLKRYDNG
jgi:hypothetical protein